MVYLLSWVPLDGVLALSRTCSLVHSLVSHSDGSSSLWRALYLDTFDDLTNSIQTGPTLTSRVHLPWKHLLQTCTLALRRAERVDWDQTQHPQVRPPNLSTLSVPSHLTSPCLSCPVQFSDLVATYTSLLHLVHTAAQPPRPSLNRLALSLISPSTLPRPGLFAPRSTWQVYHELRARLSDGGRDPLSSIERPAAIRRVWALARPGQGLFADPTGVDWEAVGAVQRLMDSRRRAHPTGEDPYQDQHPLSMEDPTCFAGTWGTVMIRDARPTLARTWSVPLRLGLVANPVISPRAREPAIRH